MLVQGGLRPKAGVRCEIGPSAPLTDTGAVEWRGATSCLLRTQYRSHDAISSWSAAEMYGGAVEAAPGAAGRLLHQLPGVAATAATETPMLLLDTRVGPRTRSAPLWSNGP